jgi:hypothetical protein
MPIRSEQEDNWEFNGEPGSHSTSIMRQSEIIPRSGDVQIETAIAAPQ